MPSTYKTPGVYIEEVSTFPPSIAAVETAIPAFIGFTEKVELAGVPTRITSLLEYEQLFGTVPVTAITLDVAQKRISSQSKVIETTVAFNGTAPTQPDYLLYYSLILFFANGGGPCYIMSVGDTTATAYAPKLFTDAIGILESVDEPTLYVFPDACSSRTANVATNSNVADIIDAAMSSCNKLQDRFTIADVHNAINGGNDSNADVTTNFRSEILSDKDIVKYGAAYFPYLQTSIPFQLSDDAVTLTNYSLTDISDSGVETAASDADADAIVTDGAMLNTLASSQTEIYNAVKSFLLNNAVVTLPPSGAIAGAYARVDSERGVWKAPANVGLTLVTKPAVNITNDLQDGLNIDAGSGKSVNAIRSFTGRGIMIWGARTLAGNDNEWKYVSVRRFYNFVEESVQKATGHFVFEPNDANTWAKVRSMIENFLTLQWRDGALAGAKPEDAFYVRVGLNQTMSADDILNGYMNVEIGMAVVRPAEFIVLKFSHMMQKS